MSIEYLAKINAHERESHVEFDEGPHIYTVDGDDSFMSVTTWNHSHFAHFDADKIITKMMNGKNWKPGYKYYGMTKDEIQIVLEDLYTILTDLGFTDTASAINCAEDTLMGEGDE